MLPLCLLSGLEIVPVSASTRSAGRLAALGLPSQACCGCCRAGVRRHAGAAVPSKSLTLGSAQPTGANNLRSRG